MGYATAVKHGEVMLESRVPVEAIMNKVPVRGIGREASLEEFTHKFCFSSLSDIKWAYQADGFYMDAENRHGQCFCHFVKDCSLAGTFETFVKLLPDHANMCVKCLHNGVHVVDDVIDGVRVRPDGVPDNDVVETTITPKKRSVRPSGAPDDFTPPKLGPNEPWQEFTVEETWDPTISKYARAE